MQSSELCVRCCRVSDVSSFFSTVEGRLTLTVAIVVDVCTHDNGFTVHEFRDCRSVIQVPDARSKRRGFIVVDPPGFVCSPPTASTEPMVQPVVAAPGRDASEKSGTSTTRVVV